MTSDADVAAEFLKATNPIYNECAHGIATLDRIIVASPTLIVSETRAALIPALYAYWERFFRLCLAEAFRVTSVAALDVAALNEELGRLFVKQCLSRTFGSSESRASYEHFCQRLGEQLRGAVARTLIEMASFEERFAKEAAVLCTQVSFADADKLVETDSNVKFHVLQRNLERMGASVAFGDVNSKLASAGYVVKTELNQMVELRNDIAHGGSIAPLSSDGWHRHREFVILLMNQVQLSLHDHFWEGAHRAS